MAKMIWTALAIKVSKRDMRVLRLSAPYHLCRVYHLTKLMFSTSLNDKQKQNIKIVYSTRFAHLFTGICGCGGGTKWECLGFREYQMLIDYNQQRRLELIFDCTFNAVQKGFKHLPIRFIIEPPHRLFDAMLARQIVIHMVHNVFAVPRRRIVQALHRGRAAISVSISAVNMRLQEPNFAREYEKWAQNAQAAYTREVAKLGFDTREAA